MCDEVISEITFFDARAFAGPHGFCVHQAEKRQKLAQRAHMIDWIVRLPGRHFFRNDAAFHEPFDFFKLLANAKNAFLAAPLGISYTNIRRDARRSRPDEKMHIGLANLVKHVGRSFAPIRIETFSHFTAVVHRQRHAVASHYAAPPSYFSISHTKSLKLLLPVISSCAIVESDCVWPSMKSSPSGPRGSISVSGRMPWFTTAFSTT